MFDQLRDSDNGRLHVTYLFIACCLSISIACVAFPNLNSVYGGFETAAWKDAFCFPFYHGFDGGSAVIHVLANAALLFIIGGFCEKTMGRMPYFILLVVFIMSNGAILKWLDRYHIAATGFVWFLLPSLQYGLIESRQLKTRNIYEDHYRFLRGIMYFTFIIPPIFFVFIQFVFRGEIGYQDALMYGLVPFAIAYVTGFAAMLIVKPIMKKRLRYFLKKKKFERTKSEKLANFAILALPLYLLVVFLI